MADFRWFLNRQGIQGRKGEKGDTGFSPTISVGTDTLDEYKLIIANESNSFETPNLRGNINIQDNGGTYLRYDAETKQISAQSIDAATADTVGGVRLSTEADIVEMGAGSVVTPSDVADALPLYLEGEGAVTITQDELTSKTKIKVDVPSVNDLESRMSTAEAEIADIQTDVTNLNNNKVAKTDLATTESAGIVKVDGTTIFSAADGTISAISGGALPIASTTQLGGVKVDGTSIIADKNGVISSVGGGGTGDVTAGGNNVFTGNNEFKKDVTITCANDLSNPSGLTITNAKNPEGYKTTFNVDSENGNFRVKTNEAIELMSQFATYIDGGQSNLSVHNNGITFTSNDVLRYYNNDGSYNYVPLVTQENIKAGENITLNKNTETGDITISSTGGGGGTGDVPIATTETAGKVKPDGTTITVTADGTISANSSYTLPTASTTQLGGVKVDGTSVTIDSNGVISAAGGGTPTNMVTTDSNQTINGTKIFANGTGTVFKGTSSNSNSLIIDGDDKEIRFNSENQSPAVIKNQGWNSTDLNIGTNFNSVKITTTLYDKNGNEIVGGSGSAGDVPIATTTTAGKVKPDGTTITVTEDGTISAAGGGGTPTNMVTTDTVQDITGKKTIVNSDGLCFKSTNSSVTSVTARIINKSSSVPNTIGKITISPDKSSGSRNGFANISYGILNDSNSSNPLYGKGGLQVTPVVDDASAEARILLGSSYNGMGNIVGTTSGLTIGTGVAGSELSITSTDITFNGQSLLNSGGDVPIATTETAGKVKPDGTTITVTEDGTISAVPTTPTNMVTTDTSQTISGAKTFTEPTVFKNTLEMLESGTSTLYIHASGSYAQGYTTDIDVNKNLNIKTRLSGGAITLAPYGSGLSALKYKDSSNSSNPSYDILHTGNLVTGNNITISEPNSTGVRTISGPSNEYMARQAMPSNRFVDITLGASSSTYTAPADGWFSFASDATTAAGQYCRLINTNSANYRVSSYSNGPKQYIEVILPVFKGQSIAVYYTAPVAAFKFIYAIGSQPTT